MLVSKIETQHYKLYSALFKYEKKVIREVIKCFLVFLRRLQPHL